MEFKSFLLISMFLFSCLMYLDLCSPVLLRNETDHFTLMAFKEAITEDPLGVLSSWNDSLNFCSWAGVSCRNQKVESLNLDNQKLRGVLTPYIGNLSFLKILNLSNNFFTGEIPTDVSRLFRLQVLKLANNTFEGEISVNLSSGIRYLNLNGNKFEGRIPAQLSLLENLIFLELESNNLVGSIPNSLGNLSSLETLDLMHNNLVGEVPSDVARLQKLRFLAVSYNRLSGTLPPQLYNISSLYVFQLSGNRFQGSLPYDIGLTLRNLEWLGLAGNLFSGTIPVSLLNCSNLRLVGAGNNFGNDLQFLSSLTNCTNLQVVNMGSNALTGSLPISIANLSSRFQFLDLRNNFISGVIPSGIGDLVNLNFLSLSLNNISGHVPDTFSKLQGLHALHLYENKLTGGIPSSLGNLTQLIILSVHNNKFDGSIPPSLANCQNLIALDISFNNLSGTIPVQLFDILSLSAGLSVAHNYLTGPVPLQVRKLKNLEVLDVSDNKFSGGIPSTLGECVHLSQLLMQDNEFDGEVPETFSTLGDLQELNLSHNKLTGMIPQFLGLLPLNYLDLSFNDLEGAVPQEGIFRNASALKDDGNHKLCGGISKLMLPFCSTSPSRRKRKYLSLKVIAPLVVASVCIAVLVFLITLYWKKRMPIGNPSLASSLSFRHPRISYVELVKATNNFSRLNLIGVGTYSSVYKGILDNEGMIVAVKVLNLQEQGGSKSFMSECETLRTVRHRNLVKILTSCSSIDFQGNDFQALVFEFMPNGNLDKWLHPESDEQYEMRIVNFVQRLNIAIDVALALDHLHHHSQPTIVHCDLKPSNVLFDSEMTAHVGGFGLAKILSSVSENVGESQTSSFVVKGTIGYVAPEYGMGSEVSTFGDVYSYGILLLEMFTGKRPTDNKFRDSLNLFNFVKMSLPEMVLEIVDPSLLVEEGTGERIQECLVAVLKVGVACSNESPNDRMRMGDVVIELSSIRDVYQGIVIQEDENKLACN